MMSNEEMDRGIGVENIDWYCEMNWRYWNLWYEIDTQFSSKEHKGHSTPRTDDDR